jgi:Alternative oxidase
MLLAQTVCGPNPQAHGLVLPTIQQNTQCMHAMQAENERMHLLTFLQLKQPGWFVRTAVLFTQVRALSLTGLEHSAAHSISVTETVNIETNCD